MTSAWINTSFVAIKHQSTIVRFGDSWDKKGIGIITPDPFGGGAYNLIDKCPRESGMVNETSIVGQS